MGVDIGADSGRLGLDAGDFEPPRRVNPTPGYADLILANLRGMHEAHNTDGCNRWRFIPC